MRNQIPEDTSRRGIREGGKGKGEWKSVGFVADFSRLLIQPGISNFVGCKWPAKEKRRVESSNDFSVP